MLDIRAGFNKVLACDRVDKIVVYKTSGIFSSVALIITASTPWCVAVVAVIAGICNKK